MIYSDIDTVHVIFKTHLDVGFTDLAAQVVDRYMTQFIPDAVALARDMQANHPDEPFRWTVGSWLIHEYFERQSPDRCTEMEAAIRDELVTWHALPFTTHTELMDASLLRYGLSISQALDERFNRQTIAGKMTDVPGHTRAMIPILAEANVRLLHIGVNPAATVPDVPPIFTWRDTATQTDIMVMYQQVYGDVMLLPNTSEAMVLVFTGDNHGPPSKDSVHETYADLRQKFPNARFVGSTLDAVARLLVDNQSDFPVVTSEIGDTWIQGIGTDPTKVSQYRELLRLRDSWVAEKRIDEEMLKAFQHAMLMIPEHTWGMDLKTHLQDYEHYSTPALVKARLTPKFQNFEASWQEQREYITSALNALENTSLKSEAEQAIQSLKPTYPDLKQYTLGDFYELDGKHWQLEHQAGKIISLKHKASGQVLADANHPLASLRYETFSSDDYDRYWHQYIRDREFGGVRVWAHPDNTKPELKVKEHQDWYPMVKNCFVSTESAKSSLLIEMTFSEEAQEIGAPKDIFMEYRETDNGDLQITLKWFGKPACRLPEAFWLSFQPVTGADSTWAIHKFDQKIDPRDVINKGARTLHGFHEGISHTDSNGSLSIGSLDASLVAPGQPSLLNFHNQLPDMQGGMHFNLYNNVWGTNFPMWFEDDAQFRFTISFEARK